jgi:hypothetical protein
MWNESGNAPAELSKKVLSILIDIEMGLGLTEARSRPYCPNVSLRIVAE